MEKHSQNTAGSCGTCGGHLQTGPFGPQCMHCLLALGEAEDDFAHVAGLFPELDIQEVIARGGFGSVFRADQRLMKRSVALKFLDADLWHTPEAVELFEPEQIQAPDHVDARADIYALGATLRRMLTGKPAREGMSEQTLLLQMQAIVSTTVAPITTLRPDLPVSLAKLCDQLLALDPSQRPPSAAAVARLLEPWCAGAELGRLFEEGRLPEKPLVLPGKKRFGLWAILMVVGMAATGVGIFQHGKNAQPPPARSAKNWSPLFSQDFTQELRHGPDAAASPRNGRGRRRTPRFCVRDEGQPAAEHRPGQTAMRWKLLPAVWAEPASVALPSARTARK